MLVKSENLGQIEIDILDNLEEWKEVIFARKQYNKAERSEIELTKNNLEMIFYCIEDTFSQVIPRFPLDTISETKTFNIALISFEYGKELYRAVYEEEIDYTDDGYFLPLNVDKRMLELRQGVILFNETMPKDRIRFTLEHEIAHWDLYHYFLSRKNPPFKYLAIEKMCDIYAANKLVPLCVIQACRILNVEELSELCGVSHQMATIRFEKWIEKVKAGKDIYYNETEGYIQKLCQPFFDEYNKNSKCLQFIPDFSGDLQKRYTEKQIYNIKKKYAFAHGIPIVKRTTIPKRIIDRISDYIYRKYKDPDREPYYEYFD